MDGSRWLELTSPLAASLLRNQRALGILQACMRGPVTPTQLSVQLGIPMSTCLRLLVRWCEAGAVRVQQTLPRAGRSIRRYEAVSRRLFCPYSHSSSELPEEVIRRLVEMRIDAQVQGLVAAAAHVLKRKGSRRWGTVVYADRAGQLVMRPDFEGGRTPDLLEQGSPAYLNVFVPALQLDLPQAKRLQLELVALLKQFKSVEGARAYSLSIVLAPGHRA
jgi:hypothetical protein